MPKRKLLITLILVVILICFAAGTRYESKQRDPLDYSRSLDQVAVTVNGEPLTLRQMAFYVAYEEAQVEPKALLYDAEHPTRYWNANMGGSYVRVSARNAAMQMAVHDTIFYQMAQEEGIGLTSEEEAYFKQAEQDFWSDLSGDGGDKRMGVSEADILDTMQRITYAEKYQRIFAELHNAAYEDYDFTGAAYAELLKEQDYKIHEKVWKRVSFGSISLRRES